MIERFRGLGVQGLGFTVQGSPSRCCQKPPLFLALPWRPPGLNLRKGAVIIIILFGGFRVSDSDSIKAPILCPGRKALGSLVFWLFRAP